ncbi:caspase domain-containing protein [Mycena epipterygia]|nr:caspase domain-containing protein [Mycena epipterygia]
MNRITPVAPSQSPGKVFALIIGIDNYLSWNSLPPLRGCVNDANMFKNFLLGSRASGGLEVPSSNIAFLADEAATRDRIIYTFQSHFLNNKAIRKGEEAAMIFYFAGHGSRVRAPNNLLPADGMVETICPHDERSTDRKGQYIHSIPDYVLGWLVSELAEKKGRNITMICDSCHSGGMGRDDSDVRTPTTFSEPVPLHLDKHLWNGKNDALSYRLWSKTAENHVLLAACAQNETACETMHADSIVRGRFTKQLVDQLRAVPLRTTTNGNLIQGLQQLWENQHPQCVGPNQHRLVFSTQFPDTMQHAFPLAYDAKNQLVVAIGSHGGVALDTRFYVYTKDHRAIWPGILAAHTVELHQTILMADNKLPPGAYAVVANWKGLILRVRPDPNFLHTIALFPRGLHTHQDSEGRKFVQSRTHETPHLVLRNGCNADEVIIEHRKSSVLDWHEFPVSLHRNIERLSNIIDGIAHFRYFLELECRDEIARLSGVTLEMHRLMGERPGRRPDPRFGYAGNLVHKFEVQVLSEPGAMYGFTIRNNSDHDLFPYLFLFDPDDYSIDCWYAPPNVHVGGPLRKRGGTITLGMGGDRAIQFVLSEGQQCRGSGFLRLFVSTTALDLGWIEQKSLLKSDAGSERIKGFLEPMGPKWNAIRVAIRMTF